MSGWYDGPSKTSQPKPFNQSDCGTGPSEIESHCLLDMNLTESERDAIVQGYKQTMTEVFEAVYEAGGWAWPLLSGGFGGNQPCVDRYQYACAAGPNNYHQTDLNLYAPNRTEATEPSSFSDPEKDVAEFLLMRGPWAYLGTGWVGCAPVGGPDAMGSNDTSYVRPAAWDRDYGEPLGLCAETSKGSGIFAREWSKATVSIDCKADKTRIVMK